MRTVVSQGKLLACERIDYLKNAQGALIATIPCVGFMEIEQGKIVTWRDYFDSANLPEIPIQRPAAVNLHLLMRQEAARDAAATPA